MASEMTQRQRAEVVAEQICDAVNTMAYPSGTITRLVRNALQEARQEALREAAERLGVGAEHRRAVRVVRRELEEYQRRRECETNASQRDMLGGAVLACSNILAALQRGRE